MHLKVYEISNNYIGISCTFNFPCLIVPLVSYLLHQYAFLGFPVVKIVTLLSRVVLVYLVLYLFNSMHF